MPDFPSGFYTPPGGVITTTGAVGLAGVQDGGFRADIAGNVAAFPAADRIIYCPVYVEVPVTVYQLGWGNGAVNASCNIQVGIYTEAGTQLVTSGTVAQSGATACQFANITDTALVPGIYYFAMVVSTTTTATFARSSIASAYLRVCGVQQQATATLPGTASFAAPASAFMPFICGSLNSTI